MSLSPMHGALRSSPASGSSSREVVYARWAATASGAGRLCSRPEVGRHGGCPLPGELAQEGCSLSAKASAYLNADDNNAAAARACQFRVRVGFFCAARHCSQPILAVCQLGGAALQTASRARLWWHQGRAVTRAIMASHWRRQRR